MLCTSTFPGLGSQSPFKLQGRHPLDGLARPLCASNGPMHPSRYRRYSITSVARASRVGGTVRPSAFAVLRLMTSSYFVVTATVKEDGLSPLRSGATGRGG